MKFHFSFNLDFSGLACFLMSAAIGGVTLLVSITLLIIGIVKWRKHRIRFHGTQLSSWFYTYLICTIFISIGLLAPATPSRESRTFLDAISYFVIPAMALVATLIGFIRHNKMK